VIPFFVIVIIFISAYFSSSIPIYHIFIGWWQDHLCSKTIISTTILFGLCSVSFNITVALFYRFVIVVTASTLPSSFFLSITILTMLWPRADVVGINLQISMPILLYFSTETAMAFVSVVYPIAIWLCFWLWCWFVSTVWLNSIQFCYYFQYWLL
jgi:hypothetical protein